MIYCKIPSHRHERKQTSDGEPSKKWQSAVHFSSSNTRENMASVGERVLCNLEQTVNAQLRFGGREARTREKDRYIYIDTIVCAYPLHSLLLETSTRIAGHVVSERRYTLTQSIVLAKTHSAELVAQNATSLSNTRLAYQTTTVYAIATHNAAEACLSLPPAPISL